MEGVGRSYVEEVALRVKPHVLRVQDRAFKRGGVTQSILTTVLLQREAMQRRDLCDG